MTRYFKQWIILLICSTLIFLFILLLIYQIDTLNKVEKQNIVGLYILIQTVVYLYGYLLPKKFKL